MTDAKKHWDEVYSANPTYMGEQPSKFFKKMLPRLQKGKVLDVAMGSGRNSIHLAKEGFQVKGFDISEKAVELAKAKAREEGLQVEFARADLDLYIMGIMDYETIIMSFFKPPIVRYYTEMIRALKQGGTLLIEAYGVNQISEAIPKDESYRNIYFSTNELLRNLNGLNILFYQEGLEDGQHVVQCLAQKPIDRDAAKFKLFDMHTKDSEHQKSKHMELAENLFKKE